MTESRYWTLSLFLPLVIPALLALGMVSAGCDEGGCFASLSSGNPVKLIVFFLVESIPFGLPLYLPLLVIALVAIRREGPAAWASRWLWSLPAIYSAAYAACLSLWGGLTRADYVEVIAIVLSFAYGYATLAWLGSRLLVRRLNPEERNP